MSRAMRMSLVLAAVLAAVVAFTVLRPDDDAIVVATPDPTSAETPATDTSADAGAEDGQATATPTPTPRPEPPLLTAGGPRKITHQRGETVAFRVRHDSADEVHVHGYDILREVPAGRTVTVRFPAELEGIFEIELESSHTQIGTLQVEP